MIKIAEAINSFAHVAKQADVSSEESVFALTGSQIQEIITRVIQPLQDEVSQLKATVANLEGKVSDWESSEEQDVNRLAVDIAYDRQRIAKLEQKQTAPTAPPRGEKTLARIAKIDEILKVRGPTTLKELERILKISPKEMTRLLAKLDMRCYELRSRPGDDREKLLRLKVQIR